MLQMFHLFHTIKTQHYKKRKKDKKETKAETEISIQPSTTIWITLMEGKLL